MKKLSIALSLVLMTCSVTAFAATEISQKEASSMKLVKTITVTEDTVNSCMDKISKAADKDGAEYYVIKGFESVGNGGQAVVIGELYNK
ncbi:DUF1471 domain-containing protein [Klebsiella pneumoniae subsp. pneumoniae]|uniref:YdgH/BhsA/McbA-like domain containing protein n=1 Tax=Klebsiella TaxID=570 RepID=UPI000F4EBBF9|nr:MULTISPECIES: YdgH/BhsA/McbA-like domain containing protein [Klebsiella]AYW18973.1 DUF1471 domain-containing protein [Klebsiella sp. P1CD1]MCT6793365.1 DUF1471 domain-containing protein [Klebsiella pneumoniae subsp. pneumoniae]